MERLNTKEVDGDLLKKLVARGREIEAKIDESPGGCWDVMELDVELRDVMTKTSDPRLMTELIDVHGHTVVKMREKMCEMKSRAVSRNQVKSGRFVGSRRISQGDHLSPAHEGIPPHDSMHETSKYEKK